MGDHQTKKKQEQQQAHMKEEYGNQWQPRPNPRTRSAQAKLTTIRKLQQARTMMRKLLKSRAKLRTRLTQQTRPPHQLSKKIPRKQGMIPSQYQPQLLPRQTAKSAQN